MLLRFGYERYEADQGGEVSREDIMAIFNGLTVWMVIAAIVVWLIFSEWVAVPGEPDPPDAAEVGIDAG